MSNINEELNYMKYLFGYKKGVVISEQKIIKEDEFDDVDDATETDDYDVTTDQTTDPKTKTVKGTIGAKLGGQKFNYQGVQRTPLELGIGFEYSRELNKELNTSGDILEKMNAEIGDKDYKALPSDVKLNLANGFFDALQVLIQKQDYSVGNLRMDKKYLRKVRRFFKKSQRWAFSVSDVDQSTDGKDYGTIKLSVPNTGDISVLEEIETSLNEGLQIVNDNNSKWETIVGIQGSLFKWTKKEPTEYEIIPQSKNKMSTMFSHISVPIDAKETKPESTGFRSVSSEVVIDKIPLNYQPGKDDPSSSLPGVMKTLYDKIYATSVTFDTDSGTKKTMTIKEMIDCGEQRCNESFDISISDISSISSASNTWDAGEVLDFTHNNDETKVKEITDLSSLGNNFKNFKLAKSRGNKLVQAVLGEFEKNTAIGLIKSFDYANDIQMEYRITDTGGKTDQDTTKDKSKYPNPGQYAKFTIGLSIQIYEKVKNPAVNLLKGQIEQKVISLGFVGKKDSNFKINFEYTPPRVNKSVYLKRGLFKNYNSPMSQWKQNLRYNRQQRLWGSKDRRRIFGNYRT
jgi:hypothetical protein